MIERARHVVAERIDNRTAASAQLVRKVAQVIVASEIDRIHIFGLILIASDDEAPRLTGNVFQGTLPGMPITT
ncbi:hypothetical protein [Alicyclobacillus ferrooxydans]|uniref:hypothetical protein n=1 Tax=Alicyclobacillus ferrooxydans TaxID=471514 RepID=UPI001FDEACFD|nr:hypothetical protein [Alicyclobacillus ferrooxydans]